MPTSQAQHLPILKGLPSPLPSHVVRLPRTQRPFAALFKVYCFEPTMEVAARCR